MASVTAVWGQRDKDEKAVGGAQPPGTRKQRPTKESKEGQPQENRLSLRGFMRLEVAVRRVTAKVSEESLRRP